MADAESLKACDKQGDVMTYDTVKSISFNGGYVGGFMGGASLLTWYYMIIVVNL